MLILNHLVNAVRKCAAYNADAQVAPACILWPDRDRQWEAALPHLLDALPELHVLGPYHPDRRSGPAIWLRCVLAQAERQAASPAAWPPPAKESTPTAGRTPILYLPGYSRQDLRAVDMCPEALKPLAELQFRGAVWSQPNGRDWTIPAVLKSPQAGLGLDVAPDQETKNAVQLALNRLLEEDSHHLHGRRLGADYFNGLLTGDPVRSLLQWLDAGDGFRQAHSTAEWSAFVAVAKSQFAFDPEAQGVLAAAAALAAAGTAAAGGVAAGGAGPWRAVWDRFCEAPQLYPRIPQQMRRSTMPAADLFSSAATHGGWPQWNEREESALRSDLLAVRDLPEHQARPRLLELERRHTPRRKLVWAALGHSPLAGALEHLYAAAAAAQPLAGGGATDLAAAYRAGGWRVDAGLLGALAAVTAAEDVAAVTAALAAFYLPWAEAAAQRLQQVVESGGYPGGSIQTAPPPAKKGGDCYLFVDGLRYDLAQRLAERLRGRGWLVSETPTWAALPSVTATAKPAVTPVRALIRGQEANVDFEPCVAATGQSLKGGQVLPKLLAGAGWQLLHDSDLGNGQGAAWAEFGDIDTEGHNRGWKLAREVDRLLEEIEGRVWQLLASGWETVQIVTDHGWLLFPGGLPKAELPAALAENKWGRCAAIKEGAATDARLYPWYWNPGQLFALADGIRCYRAGKEYTHGGLSPQECVTVQLSVSLANTLPERTVAITDVAWKRQRCSVVMEGDGSGLTADIRRQAGEAGSSIAVSPKPFNASGVASLVVENEDLVGTQATVVVLDASGQLLAQAPTVVGGE